MSKLFRASSLFFAVLFLAGSIPAQKKSVLSLSAQVQTAIANDNTQGEDSQARRVALQALGRRAGTVVVMNPRSGRVYTIVNQEWAVRRAFKPCSVIKLVTGLAGLNEGVVSSAQGSSIAGQAAPFTFSRALAASRNEFFESVGVEVGAARFRLYAQDLGFGQRTGINLAGESAGRLPAGDFTANLRQTSSHGDNFFVTPLQLATLISAIANGGALVTPHFGSDAPRMRRRFNLVSVSSLRQMLPGLAGAVQYGTARPAFDPSNRVLGKTGTCNDGGLASGLFASYAPVVNPALAIVVVTRGPGESSSQAAAIAGNIYRALKGRFGGSNQWLAGVSKYETAAILETPKRLAHAKPVNTAKGRR
jgi:cell division protein FtsI/penicillin-binding protein 2